MEDSKKKSGQFTGNVPTFCNPSQKQAEALQGHGHICYSSQSN